MTEELVEGTVLDEQGNPVAGAFVMIEADESPTHDIASVTGADGRFRLNLPEGDFSVVVTTKLGLHGMVKFSRFSADRFAPIIYLHLSHGS